MSQAAEIAIPFELQSLADAHRYQRWLRDVAMPFLGSRILELGSGIGNMSQHLPVREKLVLSDLESTFIPVLEKKFAGQSRDKISIKQLRDLTDPFLQEQNLDTIVSFNVLEHVEDDALLLRQAIDLLRKSSASGPKRIVTLVPAHQWAYSPIDKQFGHFRRYNGGLFRKKLAEAGVGPLSRENYHERYVNLPALLGWWFSGNVLGRDQIGSGNLQAFELLCPIIRPVDEFIHRVLRFPAGNSLFTVFTVKDA